MSTLLRRKQDCKPGAVHLAEGAVRYSDYGASDEMTVDLIVFKGQKKMPKREGNPEYTDWQALEAFTTSFVKAPATAN